MSNNQAQTSSKPRKVLITNDDGPPCGESPYIFGLYMELTRTLGWDVQVVIPSSQKSWIGKAFHIKEVVKGQYYYPKAPDGMGERSNVSRPLKEGEVGEWILLEATPATCTNIALYNLFPDQFDLVISGPNFGRNTSAAFALSSGTLGAALSGALSRVRAIALSYGNFQYPTPREFFSPAHSLSLRIIKQLWEDWGRDEDSTSARETTLRHLEDDTHKALAIKQSRGLRDGEVDLYAVNVPMVPALLNDSSPAIVWTRMWRNTYGRLFQMEEKAPVSDKVEDKAAETKARPVQPTTDDPEGVTQDDPTLVFTFKPDFADLVSPSIDTLPVGTDAWAIHHHYISVTPLRAAFAEPGPGSMGFGREYDEHVMGSRWTGGGRVWDS